MVGSRFGGWCGEMSGGRAGEELEGRSESASGRAGRGFVRWVWVAAPFLPIAAVTVAALVFRDRLASLDEWGYAGIFLVNVVGSGTFVLPVPGLGAAILGATIPGWAPYMVAASGAAGSTIGEVSGYLAGRGSHGAVERALGRNRWYRRVQGWIERRGAVTIFAFAATPNPFFDAAGFAAGSLRYSLWRFVGACLLGKMVKYFAVSYAAYYGLDALYRWVE